MDSDTFWGVILSIPILVGVAILLIPFFFVSIIVGISVESLIKSFLIFAVAVFLIWLLAKYQIIENGIVALIVGASVHNYFSWHPVICILIGAGIIGLLFFITSKSIGFWIKTIIFSLIVSFFVYIMFYSDGGLFTASDTIWKIFFFVVFLLENIFIRLQVQYDMMD